MSISKVSKEDQQSATNKREINQNNQKKTNQKPLTSNGSNTDLNAKTSKSKTFTDRFISESNNKKGNDIFEKWGLTAEQVAEAEKFIIQIEEKVDECCPIRGSERKKQTKK